MLLRWLWLWLWLWGWWSRVLPIVWAVVLRSIGDWWAGTWDGCAFTPGCRRPVTRIRSFSVGFILMQCIRRCRVCDVWMRNFGRRAVCGWGQSPRRHVERLRHRHGLGSALLWWTRRLLAHTLAMSRRGWWGTLLLVVAFLGLSHIRLIRMERAVTIRIGSRRRTVIVVWIMRSLRSR